MSSPVSFFTATASTAVAAVIVLLLAVLSAHQAAAGPVNINTADAATIARELKGIGLKRAQAIVDYRAKHGPFRSADEVGLVKGIGPRVLQNNRADIRTEGSRAAGPAASSRAPVSPAR